MCTIRKIPIHILKESGLFPALELLAKLWSQNRCEWGYLFVCSKYYSVGIFVSLIVTPFSLLGGILFPSIELKVLCIIVLAVIGLMNLLFYLKTQPARQFGRDVEELLDLLGQNARNAMRIPSEEERFASSLLREYQVFTLKIHKYEHADHAQAELAREALKRLIQVAREFKVVLDPAVLSEEDALKRYDRIKTEAFARPYTSAAN